MTPNNTPTSMSKLTNMSNAARLFWRSLLSKNLFEPHALAAVFPHLIEEDLWLSLAQAKSLLKGDGIKWAHFSQIDKKFNKNYNESFQCSPDWWLEQFQSTDEEKGQSQDWDKRKNLLTSLRPLFAIKIRLISKNKNVLFFTNEEAHFFEHKKPDNIKNLSIENRAWFAEKALEQNNYNLFFVILNHAGSLSKLWGDYSPFHCLYSKHLVSPEILFGASLNNKNLQIKAKSNIWSHISKKEDWDIDTNLNVLAASPLWLDTLLSCGDQGALESVLGKKELQTPKVGSFLWQRVLSSINKIDDGCNKGVDMLIEQQIKMPDHPWPNDFFLHIKKINSSNLHNFGNSLKLLPVLLNHAKDHQHQWFKQLSDKDCLDLLSALLVNAYKRDKFKEKNEFVEVIDNLVTLSGRSQWIDMSIMGSRAGNHLPEWPLIRHAVEIRSEDLFAYCIEKGADFNKKLPHLSVEDVIMKRKVSLNAMLCILTEFKLKKIVSASETITQRTRAKI